MPPARSQVYFNRLSSTGVPLGSDTRISDDWGTWPYIAYSGSTWGVVFRSESGPTYTELDATGTELGSDLLLKYTGTGARIAGSPTIDWDGERFITTISSSVYAHKEVEVSSLACALDQTAPTCPSGLVATTIDSVVELSWTPGSDPDSTVLWQYIYRDGMRIAVAEPQAGSFSEPNLPEGSYSYTVTSANLARLESAGCSSDSVTVSYEIFSDGFESGDSARWSAIIR